MLDTILEEKRRSLLPLRAPSSRIPLWLKIAYTAFVAVLVPCYWVNYGPSNFLWFSDIALLAAVYALWREDAFIASMMACGTLLLEIGWNIDYFLHLFFGSGPVGLADYMFDTSLPFWLRALSSFHFVLPPLLLYLLWKRGYHPKAWMAQTLLVWIVIPASYFAAGPEANINWAYGPPGHPGLLPTFLYLPLLMLIIPVVFILPAHLLLKAIFAEKYREKLYLDEC